MAKSNESKQIEGIVHRAALSATLAALQPIPFVDIATIGPIQVRMVQQIAQAHGCKLDRHDAHDLLKTYRLGLSYQLIALGLLSGVPYVGDLIAANIAHSMTRAFGDVADHYFRHEQKPPTKELRQIAKKSYRKYSKRPIRRDDLKKLKQQAHALHALKKQRRREHMSQTEYSRRKNELLASHEEHARDGLT